MKQIYSIFKPPWKESLLNLDDYVIPLNQFDAGDKGVLAVLDKQSLPFSPSRLFFVYNVSKGISRGNHAHKKCKQLIIVVEGIVEILIDNGHERETVLLENPSKSIYVPELTWSCQTTKSNFSSICVIASDKYEPTDYIFEYEKFRKLVLS